MDQFIKEAKNKRFPKLIDGFIAQGLDVNGVDKRGTSPMSVALSKGPIENVACLLDHGAKISENKINGVHAPAGAHMSDLEKFWFAVQCLSYKEPIYLEKLDYLLQRNSIPKPTDLSLVFNKGLTNIPNVAIIALLVNKHGVSMARNQEYLCGKVNEHLRNNLFTGFYHSHKYSNMNEIRKRIQDLYLTDVQSLVNIGLNIQGLSWDFIKLGIIEFMSYKKDLDHKDINIIALLKEAVDEVIIFLKKNNYIFNEEVNVNDLFD